jgi:hypothetical protein
MTTIEHDPLETEERRHAARDREEEARDCARRARSSIASFDSLIAHTEAQLARQKERRADLIAVAEKADLEAAQALDEVEEIDAAERARGAS